MRGQSAKSFLDWFFAAYRPVATVYLIYMQGITTLNYELWVVMGTQESAAQITGAGAAFWYRLACFGFDWAFL